MSNHLYRHFNAEGELLYVGVSLSAIKRLSEHKQHSCWFDDISKVTIETLTSRSEALQAETDAIAKEKPKHNVRKRPKPHKETRYEKRAKAARDELTARVVRFDVSYSLRDIGRLLDIGPSIYDGLIKRGELGHFVIWKKWRGDWRKRIMVSGWQLIDYLEVVHTKAPKKPPAYKTPETTKPNHEARL